MSASIAETTSQLQCLKQGGPFEVVQVSMHQFGPDEVLIRQKAVALNLVDVKQRDLGIEVKAWPRVFGIEGAGVVEAVGSNVQDLHVGDEVMGWVGSGAHPNVWGGAFQQHVAVRAFLLAKKPKSLSLEEAASLPIGFVTAVCSIINSLEIPLPFLGSTSTAGRAPSSALILGGSSVTGAAAMQLLRKAYPTLPILATSSLKHKSRLQDLGATSVVDYRSPTVVADLIAASPGGQGVDVILDCVSAGASQTDICDVLSPAGYRKYSAVMTGEDVVVPEDVQKVDASAYTMFDMQGGKQVIPALTSLVEEGIYEVPLPVKVVGNGLRELPSVLDEVKTVSGGKVVVPV